MSKYKAGDKVVLEITGTNELGAYKFGNTMYSWLIAKNFVDEYAKPLSEYTEKLEKKNQNKQKRIEKLVERLHRQAAEITRLLKENAELKEKLHEEHHELVWQDGYSQGVSSEYEKWNENVKIIRDNAFEAGLIRGHEDAWKLAHKIFKMDVSTIEEIFIETGAWNLGSVLEDCTYSEAAAKVAEWEKQEEICVGDVVRINNANRNGVVICEDFNVVSIIIPNGSVIVRAKEECTKTGRHIDVDAWLAQVGGEE